TTLRVNEIRASLRWIRALLASTPDWERVRRPIGPFAPSQIVVAVGEGWRGEGVHCVETDGDGQVVHYKVQDPSLRNWMGLAMAVRGNDISSKPEYESGRKGDGIRLWYSKNVTVENNHVHEARDVVIWYSQNVVMRDNVIEGGRYGVHLMYCDGAQVERNTVLNNSVGIYTMYSNHVTLRENDIRGQRGPSGYALGFKDADFVDVTGNVLVDNRAGIFMDGTPFSPGGYGHFSDNIFAFNDVGAILLTAVRGNEFKNNTFWENVEQVALQGGGKAGDNLWRGNYWSDYAGFDADGDGQGDTPYRAERFFESLTDREPMLRALIYSPAAQTIELAASSFPIIKPQPKLVDESPRMQPATIPPSAIAPKKPTTAMTLLGLGLLAVGAACAALAFNTVKRE
ncbi:MAG: right-handed parallel beta-helix repeat-containing protein, partial [Chloroflexota bacterium]